MLIPLELGVLLDDARKECHDPFSSRVGESILRLPADPNMRCAFDRGCVRGAACSACIFGLLAAALRPGMGNENFEVLPMVATCLSFQLVSRAKLVTTAVYESRRQSALTGVDWSSTSTNRREQAGVSPRHCRLLSCPSVFNSAVCVGARRPDFVVPVS